MVNTSCAVLRCGSSSHRTKKGLKFHQFPRDERSHLWIQACKRPDLLDKDVEQLKHVHICSLHFEQRMYGKQLLKKSAVPTLQLPLVATASAATQTDGPEPAALHISTSQGVQTDGGARLLRPRGTRADEPDVEAALDNFLELCDVFLPYSLSVVVKSHIAVAKDY